MLVAAPAAVAEAGVEQVAGPEQDEAAVVVDFGVVTESTTRAESWSARSALARRYSTIRMSPSGAV